VKAGNTNRRGERADQQLPLVFGVSGHRDLVARSIPTLRKQLSRVFSSFRAAYPHTPFQLLTPLAEGADRLAAEVALASGIDLIVPLPMEQAEYERDFITAKSLAEFRALLARAKSRWEIPMAAKAGTRNRTRQYAKVGELIARDSHVLILLWDGEENRKIGGTAWVRMRRDHWVRKKGNSGSDRKGFAYGPTIQVVTPRVSGSRPRPRPAIIGELPPNAGKQSASVGIRSRSRLRERGE